METKPKLKKQNKLQHPETKTRKLIKCLKAKN